jgi:NADH-quinone oxidoreductase subunit N
MTPFDLTVPAQLASALGPDLVMVAGATVMMLWSAWRRESDAHQRSVGTAALGIVVATMGLVVVYWVTGQTAKPGVIAVDNFRWASDMIVLIGAFCTIALSIEYNAREEITTAESHALVLFATSGMMLLAGARDLMIVFLGIEVMSVSVYILSAMNRRSNRSAEGALKYFLLGAFSTAFLLYGIALVYGATGATDLPTIYSRINQYNLFGSPALIIGVALLVVGFGFKVAAVPFHMWAPDVYEGAPTPITAFMAASVKAAAFAAFLRVWIEAFPYIAPGRGLFYYWHNVIWGLAVATMIVGNIVALAQKNIKRLLAYSSIAHAGYVLAALVAGDTYGASAYVFYLLAYTLATFGAFAVVIALGNRGEPNLDVDDYAGLWRTRPALAVSMSVFMLSLLGFPIAGGLGFVAKWYVLQAALRSPDVPQVALATTIVLTSVISAGYYLRVVQVMFMKPRPEHPPAAARTGWWTEGIVFASVILVLVFGVIPYPLMILTEKSVPHAVTDVPQAAQVPIRGMVRVPPPR